MAKTPFVLRMPGASAGAYLGKAAFKGAGLVAGAPLRGVDAASKFLTGQSLFGRGAHALFDGTRFEGKMKSVADWLHLKACFAAGTPLWWEGGHKPIEQFVVGERVWSRDEFDPNGELALKVIEEVFVRTAPILALRVDGREIRTTGEHPFYAEGKE